MDSLLTQNGRLHFCYVLINASKRNTYVGYTVTPKKRIRQHNCEIKGGAKYTKRHGPGWSFALVLTSPAFDSHRALSLEWHMKPHGRRSNQIFFDPMQRRIELLQKALANPKFAGERVTMYVVEEYVARVTEAMASFPNVSIERELDAILVVAAAAAATEEAPSYVGVDDDEGLSHDDEPPHESDSTREEDDDDTSLINVDDEEVGEEEKESDPGTIVQAPSTEKVIIFNTKSGRKKKFVKNT